MDAMDVLDALCNYSNLRFVLNLYCFSLTFKKWLHWSYNFSHVFTHVYYFLKDFSYHLPRGLGLNFFSLVLSILKKNGAKDEFSPTSKRQKTDCGSIIIPILTSIKQIKCYSQRLSFFTKQGTVHLVTSATINLLWGRLNNRSRSKITLNLRKSFYLPRFKSRRPLCTTLWRKSSAIKGKVWFTSEIILEN